ncbi:MAG: glycosyltransferase [Oligoflexia bacterium]|nr:glycosyltransferase [Oligoflexia bacterium]
MKNSIEISFFVPCYNEASRIIPTFKKIINIGELLKLSLEIIVCNDSSTDNSLLEIQKFCDQNTQTRIHIINNTKQNGVAYNYFNAVTIAKGTYYMLISGDDAEDKNSILEVIKLRGKAEMIIPYLSPDSRKWIRIFLSNAFTMIVNLSSGNKIKYYNGNVLHLRRNLLNIKTSTNLTGIVYQAEIILKLLKKNTSYIEVPTRNNEKKGWITSALRPWNFLLVTLFFSRILTRRLIDYTGLSSRT